MVLVCVPTGDDGKYQLDQDSLMQQLDKDYQTARIKTHTQRSFGLGFGSLMAMPPQQVAPAAPAAPTQAPAPTQPPAKKE